MSLLAFDRVSLAYENHTVVSDLTFTVNPGDYLCIVGENGSGKSTTVRAILGLKAPASGTIVRAAELGRSDIGYLPQQTALQRDFPASVREVVLSGFAGKRIFPVPSAAERRRAAQIMEQLGITALSGRCYRELSGGQQQRVLLARALCAAQTLLLLDEPTAGLDPHATDELYRLIARLNRDSGITVIMVSHDIPAAVRYASHILHLAHVPLFFGTRDAYVRAEIRQDGAATEEHRHD